MSIKTNRQRPLLCYVDKVSTQSLPISMQHSSVESALEDARSLILFLQDICAHESVSEEGTGGLLLALELLQDKLEIGMGRYKFPFSSHTDDAPALVERRN